MRKEWENVMGPSCQAINIRSTATLTIMAVDWNE